MLDRDGYRPNVGIILCNGRNEVFWGKRVKEHSWQFPQGGIKLGETPVQAMYRELREEVGLLPTHVKILGRTRNWLRYEVPVQWLLDDAPMYRYVPGSGNGIADPDRVIRMWMQEFDGMRGENGCFVLTMHPWISGRAGRLLGLEQLIRHMRATPGVWFATVGEIAEWAVSSCAMGAPTRDPAEGRS